MRYDRFAVFWVNVYEMCVLQLIDAECLDSDLEDSVDFYPVSRR